MDDAEKDLRKIYGKLLDEPSEKIEVGDALAGYKTEGTKTILWFDRCPRLMERIEETKEEVSDGRPSEALGS